MLDASLYKMNMLDQCDTEKYVKKHSASLMILSTHLLHFLLSSYFLGLTVTSHFAQRICPRKGGSEVSKSEILDIFSLDG
jgi:hypothetical protein